MSISRLRSTITVAHKSVFRGSDVLSALRVKPSNVQALAYEVGFIITSFTDEDTEVQGSLYHQ